MLMHNLDLFSTISIFLKIVAKDALFSRSDAPSFFSNWSILHSVRRKPNYIYEKLPEQSDGRKHSFWSNWSFPDWRLQAFRSGSISWHLIVKKVEGNQIIYAYLHFQKFSYNFEDEFKIDHSPFLLDPGPIIVYACQSLTHWLTH